MTGVTRKKWLKILLLISGVAFSLFLVMSAYVYNLQRQGKIKGLLITEVNKHLEANIHAEQIKFTFFKHFPSATLVLEQVKIEDPIREEEFLLQADKVHLQFNPIKLLQGNYSLKRCIIEHAELELYINKNGEENYMITKRTGEESGSFHFDLSGVSLNQVLLVYLDERHSQHYSFFIDKSNAKGVILKDELSFSFNGNVHSHFLVAGKDTLLVNLPLLLKSDVLINSKNHSLNLQNGEIKLNESQVDIDGTINYYDAETMDLHVNSKFSKVHDLLIAIPKNYIDLPSNIIFDGNLKFNSTLSGSYKDLKNLKINLDFNVAEGSVAHSSQGEIFNGGKATGKLLMKSGVSLLNLSTFHLEDGADYVSGNLQDCDLINGMFNGHIDCDLDLQKITEQIELDTNYHLSGRIRSNIDFNALSLNSKNIDPALLGKVDFLNVGVSSERDSLTITDLSGTLVFEKLEWLLQEVNGNSSIGDFKLNGKLINVLSAYYNNKEKAYIDVDISSKNINLNQLASSSSTSSDGLNLPSNFIIRSNLSTDHFQLEKLVADQLQASLIYNQDQLNISNIKLQTMDGDITGDLIIEQMQNGTYKFYTTSTLNKVDINQLFEVFENFGQEEITTENIFGNINAESEISGVLSKDFDLDFNSIHAVTQMKLSDGRLLNYSTLVKLSDFVLVDDLADVQFQDLENKISIQDGKVIIPEMYINTNTYDLWVSGSQTFENEIDYRIKIGLNQLLSTKARKKKENSEFGTIKEQDSGMNIFVKITGTTSDPVFAYDTENAREQLKTNLNVEKKLLDQIIREEMGWKKAKKDSIKNSAEHFEIEWDDE